MGTVLSRYVLSTGAAAALFAGCGGSQPPLAPGAMVMHAERVTAGSLSNIAGHDSDGGKYPQAPLVDVGGILYGTTSMGGAFDSHKICRGGCGIVFSITTSGAVKLLHSFGSSQDGQYPQGGLVAVGGTLYGTTSEGGAFGYGTVYSITTDGVENVLHSFGQKGDGAYPLARSSLIEVGRTLYGTTTTGGAFGGGTVFVVTTDGKGRTLHSFSNLYRDDGNLPQAGLTDVKGTLYGTTPSGGGCDVGTVYSITTTGVERVLHSFADGILCQGQIDGAIPTASLIDVNGLLYGTTEDGGGFPKICHNGRSYIKGCGTVFSITTAGQVKLLRRFH